MTATFPILSRMKYPQFGPQGGLIGAWSPSITGYTGNKFYDLGLNGIHGDGVSLEDTDWVVRGGGMSVVLDGSAESINLGNSQPLRVTGSLTESIWFNCSTVPVGTQEQQLLSKDKDTGGRGYCLDIVSADQAVNYGVSGPAVRYYINGGGVNQNNGSNIIVGSTVISAGTWYHVVGVYDAPRGTLDIFVNGRRDMVQKTGESTAITDATTANLHIGRREYFGYYNFYNGAWDDAVMWKRPLSEVEVTLLHSLGRGGWAKWRRRRATGFTAAAPPTFTGKTFKAMRLAR